MEKERTERFDFKRMKIRLTERSAKKKKETKKNIQERKKER